jgi:hypothetical protein
VFEGVLQKIADQAPTSIMVRGLTEHLLNAERIDRWFETTRAHQYACDILFSSLAGVSTSLRIA